MFRLVVSRNCCHPRHVYEEMVKLCEAGDDGQSRHDPGSNNDAPAAAIEIELFIDEGGDDNDFELTCARCGDLLYSGRQDRRFPTPRIAYRMCTTHAKRPCTAHTPASAVAGVPKIRAATECAPCEGDESTPSLNKQQAQQALQFQIVGSSTDHNDMWSLNQEGTRLRCTLRARSFVDALRLFQLIGDQAERLGHHPDLHLTNYNVVEVGLWTFSRQCLTQYDFTLAVEINRIIINHRDQPDINV